MKSLSRCIEIHNKNGYLSTRDIEKLKKSAQEYRDEGLVALEANKSAIDDFVQDLAGERTDILTQAKKQGYIEPEKPKEEVPKLEKIEPEPIKVKETPKEPEKPEDTEKEREKLELKPTEPTKGEQIAIGKMKGEIVSPERKGKKAVIPEEPIKAPTTGKQETLLPPKKGETVDMFEKKEGKEISKEKAVEKRGASDLDIENLSEEDIQTAISKTPEALLFHPPSIDTLAFYKDQEGNFRGIAVEWTGGTIGFTEKNEPAWMLDDWLDRYKKDKNFRNVKKIIKTVVPEKLTIGMVRLDKGGVKPFTKWREITKGVYKGKIEVILSNGKKINVRKEQVREWPGEVEEPGMEEKPTKIIKDFGEKIGGARKDYYAEYADKMKSAKDIDIAVAPLSQSWPEPDYDKLIEEGSDPWIVAFIHSSRDEIPIKPRQSWKQSRWVGQVKVLRGFSENLLSGEIAKEKIQSQLAKKEFAYLSKELGDKIDLYLEVGHAKSLKGIRISKGSYSIFEGKKFEHPKIIYSVEQPAKKTAFSHWPRQLATGETREEAIENFKAKYDEFLQKSPKETKRIKFSIYSMRDQKGVWIGKKIGRNYIDLEKFDSTEEARKYLKNNQEALEEKLRQYKTIPSERREVNRERIGKDHRNGKDVTPEMFTELFGFRGVEFGNWVINKERQDNLNRAYDALMDLAAILDIPTQAISLNGELGLGFGSRGKGGIHAPSAHYEPDKIVINLTRKSGPGSLAHEWWHALDNYFSRGRGQKLSYLSENAQKIKDDPTRIEILNALKNVVDAIESTALRKRSNRLDSVRSKAYWGTGREMTARAFEQYVIEKLSEIENVNDYLANIVSDQEYGKDMVVGLLSGDLTVQDIYPYLLDEEIEKVRNAFDNLFKTIETQQTDKGIQLYALEETEDLTLAPITSEILQNAFPGSKIQTTGDVFNLTLPNGSNIVVTANTGVISPKPEVVRATYGRKAQAGEIAVAAWKQVGKDGLLWLSKYAGQERTHHEAMHAAFDLVLNGTEKRALLRKYKSEENAAKAYGKWDPSKRDNIFTKILKFFRNILEKFYPTSRKIFERVRTGEVWERPAEEVKGEIKYEVPSLKKIKTPEEAVRIFDLKYDGRFEDLPGKPYAFTTKDGFSITVENFTDIPDRLRVIENRNNIKYALAGDPDVLAQEIINEAVTGKKYSRANIEQERQEFDKTFNDSVEETVSTLKTIFNKKQGIGRWIPSKADLNLFDLAFSTPLHYSKKIGAYLRMFLHGNRKMDNISEMIDRLTKDPRDAKGKTYYTNIIREAEKRDPEGFNQYGEYRRWQDHEQYGYRVKFDGRANKYRLYAPGDRAMKTTYDSHADARRAGRTIARNKSMDYELIRYSYSPQTEQWKIHLPKNTKPLASFDTQNQAVEEGLQRELADYKAEYNPSELIMRALEADKRLTLNGFDTLMSELRNQIRWYEARGLELPSAVEVIAGEEIKVNLRVQLAMMGDRRGYYFPRNRNQGKYMLVAEQKGKSPFLQFFDVGAKQVPDDEGNIERWKTVFNIITPLGKQYRDLIRQGFRPKNIEVKKAPRTLEDVFVEQTNRIINLQTEINDALRTTDPKKINLEKLNLRFIDRMLKPGQRDFAVFGSTNKEQRKIIKDLGGQFYALFPSEPKAWHFKNPGRGFETKLARALVSVSHVVDQEAMNLFTQAFIENLANLERARGHRMHMIRRNFTRGDDVYRGYEENPSIALTSYIAGIAGGEAKKIMALDLTRAFLGTDISWNHFQWMKAYKGTWEDYLKDFRAVKGYVGTFDRFKNDNPKTTIEQDAFEALKWLSDHEVTREDFDKINEPQTVEAKFARIEELKEQRQTAKGDELKKIGNELADLTTWMHDSYTKLIDERKIDNRNQTVAWRDGKTYIENLLRNDEPIDRITGVIKGIAVFKYLAGRISAPIINLTAQATIAPASLNVYAKIPLAKAFGFIARGTRDYGLYRAGKMDGLTEDELWALSQIRAKKWDSAKFNREALTALESKLGRKANATLEALMIGFSATEILNRGGTVLGAFQGIKKYNRKLTNEEALNLAKEVSDKAHSVYNKANWPRWARGSGFVANIGRAFYIFKSFSMNYLLTMKDAYGPGLVRIPQNKTAFAWLAISPAILSGTGAIIGREFLFKLMQVFGLGGDDPEEAFYEWVAENFGDYPEQIARFGAFGTIGINLKGSLSINMTDVPTNLVDLLGAPGSMLYEDPKQMVTAARRGNYWKAIEKFPLMPLFISNPIKSLREKVQGVTTGTNAPVFYKDQPLAADTGEMILRFMSFNPVGIAGAREKQWSDVRLFEKYQTMRSDILARFKAHYLQPPESRTQKELNKLLQDVQEYNMRVKKRGLRQRGVPLLGWKARPGISSIRSSLRRAFRPSRRERLRAQNE